MINTSRVDTDQLHLFVDQPLRCRFAQSRRMAEILLAIGVLAMPAGIDEHDVAGLDRGLDLFEIDRLDQFPFALRDRERDPAAEEAVKRQLADGSRFRDEMDRRIPMRRGMDAGSN